MAATKFVFALIMAAAVAETRACKTIKILSDITKDSDKKFYGETFPWLAENVGSDLKMDFYIKDGEKGGALMCVLKELKKNVRLQATYLKCEADGEADCVQKQPVTKKKVDKCIRKGKLVKKAEKEFRKQNPTETPLLIINKRQQTTKDPKTLLQSICALFKNKQPYGCRHPLPEPTTTTASSTIATTPLITTTPFSTTAEPSTTTSPSTTTEPSSTTTTPSITSKTPSTVTEPPSTTTELSSTTTFSSSTTESPSTTHEVLTTTSESSSTTQSPLTIPTEVPSSSATSSTTQETTGSDVLSTVTAATEASEATKATEPSDATEQSEATTPSEATEQTEQTKATEQSEATTPSEATEQTEQTEATEASESTEVPAPPELLNFWHIFKIV